MFIAGYPNMFLITGPQSPSVLTNMVTSVEQHVDWIAGCIETVRAGGKSTVETTPQAQDEWFLHSNELAGKTLLDLANSCYVGANIPGKPRVVMPYVGGAAKYAEILADVAVHGYKGLSIG
jgi:cyclohexanone monooxygenase